jgi:hypothetical protein
VSMKVTACLDIAPSSLVVVPRFRDASDCLHHQGGCPEMSVYFYEATRCYIPEGCRLQCVCLVCIQDSPLAILAAQTIRTT